VTEMLVCLILWSKIMNSPQLIYGTAWKEGATTDLVKTALSLGFSGIDTANQPMHYQETLVGDALQDLFKKGLKRETLFLQTKFTPADGQDSRIPYDSSAALHDQVKQSFESSLEHLHTDYVDSYLLHGPYSHDGIGEADLEVWHAMEEIYRSGKAKSIGISNVDLSQLESLTSQAEIKPVVVQNRCYANQGWDKTVREFCQANDIIYQGFSLLTANPFVLEHATVKNIAERLKVTTAEVIFCFAIQIGMVVLTGTTDQRHMKADLETVDLVLTPDELQLIETIG